MTFKSWIKAYENENSARGDLARAIRDDNKFPKCEAGKNSYRQLLMHLIDKQACYLAIEAFDGCWIEYQMSEVMSIRAAVRKEVFGEYEEDDEDE